MTTPNKPSRKLLMQVLTPTSEVLADNVAKKSKPSRGRSSTDLISRLYTQIDAAIDEVESSSDPVTKKVEALKSIAKTLPLLQAAERSASLKVKHKQIEEMTDAELDALVARQQAARKKEEKVNEKDVAQSDSKISDSEPDEV